MKQHLKIIIPLLAAGAVVCGTVSSLAGYKTPVFAVETGTAGEDLASLRDRVSLRIEEESREVPEDAEEKNESAAPGEEKAPEGTYTDGVYEGTGTGYGGPLKVEVTIRGGRIAEIRIASHSENEPFFSRAASLTETICAEQSTDVDTISGATFSSRGIINAVKDALDKASGGGGTYVPEAPASASASIPGKGTTAKPQKIEEPSAYKDGVYLGSGTGFGGTLTVEVTVKNGKISSIRLVSHSDNTPYITNAGRLFAQIVKAQSTNVDTVSGATYSSNGIIEATRNALSKAKKNPSQKTSSKKTAKKKAAKKNSSKKKTSAKAGTDKQGSSAAVPVDVTKETVKDGTYEGTGRGRNGTIIVQVTLKAGKIESIKVKSHSEDAPFFKRAKALLDTIVEAQSTDVDTVTGATLSSNGILEAVNDALKKAGNGRCRHRCGGNG